MLIDKKEDLTYEKLITINPKYIFFPYWSYVIPKSIYEKFECVIFHMTDVPFGRGGSPLQNLVARGIYETKISALRCEEFLDAGPVYLKKNFFLYGAAEEIYLRASKVIGEMIDDIIVKQLQPEEQVGEVVYFSRKKPEEGNIANLKELEQVFDYIRMLDAEGYPNAYIENNSFRFEFKRASLKKDKIIADVIITKKKESYE